MSCKKCKGTGVIVTGNNDLPCDCSAGQTALFQAAGVGLVVGAFLSVEISSRNSCLGNKPIASCLRKPHARKCECGASFVGDVGMLQGQTTVRSAGMDGYRQATSFDYAYIVRLLIDGDEKGVMVRSLFRSDMDPYPLLDISRGPFNVSEDGVEGFTKDGEFCVIRITDTLLHNVELKRGNNDWMAPEMGSVILLVPK